MGRLICKFDMLVPHHPGRRTPGAASKLDRGDDRHQRAVQGHAFHSCQRCHDQRYSEEAIGYEHGDPPASEVARRAGELPCRANDCADSRRNAAGARAFADSSLRYTCHACRSRCRANPARHDMETARRRIAGVYTKHADQSRSRTVDRLSAGYGDHVMARPAGREFCARLRLVNRDRELPTGGYRSVLRNARERAF